MQQTTQWTQTFKAVLFKLEDLKGSNSETPRKVEFNIAATISLLTHS